MEDTKFIHDTIVFDRYDTVEIEKKDNFKYRGFLIYLGHTYQTNSKFVHFAQISYNNNLTTITQVMARPCKLVLFEKTTKKDIIFERWEIREEYKTN